jgi:hypothetical protein
MFLVAGRRVQDGAVAGGNAPGLDNRVALAVVPDDDLVDRHLIAQRARPGWHPERPPLALRRQAGPGR